MITRRSLLGAAVGALAGRAAPGCGPDLPVPDPARELGVGPGGWCWFQSPRACLDHAGRLWLGSSQGTGAQHPGSVDVTCVDLAAWRVVHRRSLGVDRVDDHTSPSLLPIGSDIQVGWAPHRRADWLEVGSALGEVHRIRRPASVEPPGRGTSYVSAHLVGGRRWLLYRGESFSWNLLTSSDGRSWKPAGLIVEPPAGGHRPYLHAIGDGERLRILVSDGNPSEYRGNGIGAATINDDLTIEDGIGRRIGTVGRSPAPVTSLTRVLDGRRGRSEPTDTDIWLVDLQLHGGQPVAVLSARDRPSGGPSHGRWRHRYLLASEAPGGRWQVRHLAWAGSELYGNQPDYTGLAALDPADPKRVVISTDVHPTTAEPLRSDADGLIHRELYQGRRDASGWRWTPLTRHSIEDHLRPVLVARPGRPSVLAWMRGTYRSWMDFSTTIAVRSL